MITHAFQSASALILCAALLAPEGESDASSILAAVFEVHPARVELSHTFDYAQLLLSARRDDGSVVDLTRTAVLAEASPFVSVSERGVVTPVADGEGELSFRVGDERITVPFRVSGVGAEFSPSFVRDVMPILSKTGCTAGGCHGSADGQNGFKLSLRGYDPRADHASLTDDLAGRRFNPVSPEQSLFLLKPSASVPHEGGLQLPAGSREYEILRAWVSEGAHFGKKSERATSIEIFPKKPTIPAAEFSQQFAVHATYADGSVRDVTREAFIETNAPDVAKADGDGIVAALRRGEAAVMARYEGQYAATSFFVMGDREGFEWAETPEYNWVDTLVYKKLRRIKALPSETCTDPEFLRRVSLDLTGLPPTAKETRTFLMDARDSRKKREEQIDRLIGSAEFVDHWTNKWADLLQVNSKFLGQDGAHVFRDWIRASVASNAPYDGFVAEIMNASGSTYANPPAAFYKIHRKPDEAMESTTQLFLGVRFNCNKCHDHPFERWTQDQHWQLSAFFGRVGRKNAEGAQLIPKTADNQIDGGQLAFEEIISDLAEGDVRNPDTGKIVPPEFPFEHAGGYPAEAERREQLTRWLTAEENPYFARSYVNRLWSYFLGLGLIDPVDDIRAGNPPTNPELLERLTREFVDSGFDVRSLMRTICRSRTYQHSIRTNAWNEDDEVNFSHALARRLPAEVLYDALHRATGAKTRLPGVRAGTLAGELVDASVKATDGFLDLFGRPPRESVCECERQTGMSLGQALSLVNGPTVADAIRDPENDIANLVAVEKDSAKIVEELFLAFFCRKPTQSELDEIEKTFVVTDTENRAALAPEDHADLERRLTEFEAEVPVITWSAAKPGSIVSAGGAELASAEDGSVRVTGANPDKDTYTVIVTTDVARITGIRLEVLPDPELPASGPGRSKNGNFVLNELRVLAVPLDDPMKTRPLVLQHATANYSQGGWAVAGAVDGKPESGWAVSPRFGKPHTAVFELAENVGSERGTLLAFTLDQQYGEMHTLGHFRISVTSSPRPIRHHGLPEAVAEVLRVPAGERTPEQAAIFYAHFMKKNPEFAAKIRLGAAQDLAWALVNSPAFLFNR